MDLQRLQEDLEDDEGVVYEIYLDHLGLPTFGIGHLVREEDPESVSYTHLTLPTSG